MGPTALGEKSQQSWGAYYCAWARFTEWRVMAHVVEKWYVLAGRSPHMMGKTAHHVLRVRGCIA